MNLLMIICVLAILTISEGLTVTGPSDPLVVPLGGSVLLPCSVDELLPLEDLEVEWKRSDSLILIHLYKDGDIRPEDQDEDFSGRAFFFTDDIKRGNFSLLLKNVRKEDEGEYTCSVHSGEQSGETVMEIKVERLMVSGSDVSISVNVGEDVTLNCSVDSHISPEDIEEVVWKKRIENEYITVRLYQNKEVYPDASDEIYRDRVEFFTDEIPRGNFSLRLKRVRTEDKGLYMCQVFAGTLSANTTVILGQLGLSSLHIIVLILCISACGSALLFSSLIYCRSNNIVLRLQVLLVFCPNSILFLSFILWGFIEGSLHESVSCALVYFMRPLMLFWAAPFLKDFPDTIRKWIDSSSIDVQVAVFTVLFYSILLRRLWNTIVQYTDADRVMIAVLFLLLFLLCLIRVIKGVTHMIMENISDGDQTPKWINNVLNGWDLLSCRVLPLLQFTLLFYCFGAGKHAFFVTGVLPLIVMLSDQEWYLTCMNGCSPWLGKTVRLIIMLVVNAALFPLMFLFFKTMVNEKEHFALAWMICLFQVLWMIRFSSDYLVFPRTNSLYLFGAVGLVFVNSVVLMTELILKSVNGDRTVGDLRKIVFPSECIFIFIGMAAEIFVFLRSLNTKIKQERIKKNGCKSKETSQRPSEFCEMDPLPPVNYETLITVNNITDTL